MDKLPKVWHQMRIEEVYKIKDKFGLNNCFPHIFPVRLVLIALCIHMVTWNCSDYFSPITLFLEKRGFTGQLIQSTLIIADTFGTSFCVQNGESVMTEVIFSQTSIDTV